MALIINELLCYMLAKIDSVPTDTLTRLVNENFSDSEVDTAKSLLCEHVDDSIKAGNKRGQHKKKNNLDDIVKVLVQCDRGILPKFVALDLSKLPPISIDCIDVSSLVRKQQLQEVEIANLKDLVHDILMVTAETSKRLEAGHLAKPRCCETYATCTGNVSEASSTDSGDSVEPKIISSEVTNACTSGTTYSEVLRDATSNPDSKDGTIANRKKRGKVPTPRKPSADDSSKSAATTLNVSSKTPVEGIKVRSTANKAVIGSRKTGPIKAVTVVKRLSMFMSRLPPGTGEDAVKSCFGADRC